MRRPHASPRLLFLFTELCANGGIQRFNQTLLAACANYEIRCDVLSLQDSPITLTRFAGDARISLRGFSGNRARFVAAALIALWRGGHAWVLIGHINFLRFAVAASLLRPLRRPRMALIAHGIEVWSGIGPIRRTALRGLHKILCVSRYTSQRINEQAPAVPAARLKIFPNALAHTWSAAMTTTTRTLPPRFLLSVTRLEKGDRYKGIVTVIETLAMLSDESVEYCIVGQGNDLHFLEQIAERCGVRARVHFMRAVGDADLVELYRRCSAFVLPSGKEGFGIVFLEAMYFGAPVIAAAEKGALDVVQDGSTGLLVPYGDSVALRRAIERILQDTGLVDRLRCAARASVQGDGDFTFASFSRRCGQELGLPAKALA